MRLVSVRLVSVRLVSVRHESSGLLTYSTYKYSRCHINQYGTDAAVDWMMPQCVLVDCG